MLLWVLKVLNVPMVMGAPLAFLVLAVVAQGQEEPLNLLPSPSPPSEIPASAASPAPGPLGKEDLRGIALRWAAENMGKNYVLRDGHWAGDLTPSRARVLEVSLLPGNDYWFMVSSSQIELLHMAIFDELGRPLEAPVQRGEGVLAMNIQPAINGPHYVKLYFDAPKETALLPFFALYAFK